MPRYGHTIAHINHQSAINPSTGTLPMPRYGHTIAAVECIRQRADVAVVKLLKGNRDAAARALADGVLAVHIHVLIGD